jgi:hypothetical protein
VWVRFDDVEVLVRPDTQGSVREHCPAERGHAQGLPLASADEDLLPVREAARLAGVSRSTAHAWVRRGLLAVQPTQHGRLPSLGAVRVLAGATHEPCPAAGPREAPADDDAEYVLPYLAARQLGVPEQRVHHWLRTGHVASQPSRHGRLVRLIDVQELAQARRPNRS